MSEYSKLPKDRTIYPLSQTFGEFFRFENDSPVDEHDNTYLIPYPLPEQMTLEEEEELLNNDEGLVYLRLSAREQPFQFQWARLRLLVGPEGKVEPWPNFVYTFDYVDAKNLRKLAELLNEELQEKDPDWVVTQAAVYTRTARGTPVELVITVKAPKLPQLRTHQPIRHVTWKKVWDFLKPF